MTTTKKVKLDLVGLDGNAFVLMGTFKSQARKEGWTQEGITAIERFKDVAAAIEFEMVKPVETGLTSSIIDKMSDINDKFADHIIKKCK